MKSKHLKLMLSGSASVLAIALAFATNVDSKQSFAPEFGYIQNIEPCDTPVQCDTEEGDLCTVIQGGVSVQAKGKLNPTSTSCEVELYMPRP